MESKNAILRRLSESCVAGIVVTAVLYAFPFGPPPAKTGAPGEQTCSQCHSGGMGGGRVELASSAGATYLPGVAQQLTITITDADAQVYGFELSARVVADNSQAGTLAPAAGEMNIRVICGDGSLRPVSGCPPGAPIEYIEHGAPRLANTFRVQWTPPSSDRGMVRIYVAANAANGDGDNDGDDIYISSLTLTSQAGGAVPSISQGGVVNAWSSKDPIGDAAWIAIYGSNLAPTTRTWRTDEVVGGRLPTSLDGVSVKFNNQDAYVYFISRGQLNVQIPADAAAGPVPVRVTTPSGTSNTLMVSKQATAPGLFTWAGLAPGSERFVGAVSGQLKPDGTLDYIAPTGLLPGLTTRPARPSETVLLFATGCGPTNPAFPAGQVVSSPFPTLGGTVSTWVGGIPAQLAGNTGFLVFAGECQFNVTIPSNAPDGNLPVLLDIGGVSTQTTQPEISIPVQRQPEAGGVLSSIQVAFRLDPWLISGTYGGGVWVSPPVLGPTTQGGPTFALQTKSYGLDAQGVQIATSPQWIPSDPGMVTVSPTQGELVTITVQRAGESTLQLTAGGGVSKTLTIKATAQVGVLTVQIAQ